jgi:hypothetical protein
VIKQFAKLDIPHSAIYAEGSGADSPTGVFIRRKGGVVGEETALKAGRVGPIFYRGAVEVQTRRGVRGGDILEIGAIQGAAVEMIGASILSETGCLN